MLRTIMNDRLLIHTNQIQYKWILLLLFFFLQDAQQAQAAQENGAVFAGGVELIQPVSFFFLPEKTLLLAYYKILVHINNSK